MKSFSEVTKAGKAETHVQRVARCVSEIGEAERLLGDKRPKKWLVTFRLKDAVSLAKGPYSERHGHLEARIKALSGVRHHDSTSCWAVKSRHETATLVLNLLKPAIDETIDYLQVEQTGAPARAGVPRLKS